MEFSKTDNYSKFLLSAIFIIMTFFLLASSSGVGAASKVPAVFMLVLLIISLITGKFNKFPKTVITPIVISIAAYILIYTISLFYATTGQFALTVFSYYLGGVSVFMLTILLVNRNPINTNILLAIVAFVVGIAGIFSIDAASVRILTPGLESLLSSILNTDSVSIGGFEAGTRMTSIIGNPNVFASLSALGTLSAAYLFLSSNSKREKNISSGLLILNAVSLLYCFSLGSLIGMFFAIIGFLVFVGKELRASTVYVTLSTIIIAFLSVFIGFTGMGKTGALAFIPIVSLIIFGFVLGFILRYTEKVSTKVNGLGSKKITIILLTSLLLILAFIIAALTISKPYTFDTSNTSFKRGVTVETGDYQLKITSSDRTADINVIIESQSYNQASTQTSSVLYQGPLDNSVIKFTVPVDSNICFITMSSANGGQVNEIAVMNMDGTIIKSIMPDYLLLPTFMANRLQGIFVNENAAQRIVFIKDGMKIAATSPIIGHGPGAYESNILSVQDYYYATRGAHNHYVQTLDEVGIVGLLAFLSIFTFSIVALVKKGRSTENRALYGILFAMLIMIVIHTALEVTFIYGIYNMVAFMIFGLISSKFSQQKLSVKEISKAAKIPPLVRTVSLGICIALLAINLGQFASVSSVKKAAASGDALKFFDSLKTGTVLDFTNDVSYKTSYLVAYSAELPDTYLEQANKYAEDLEKHNSFSTLTELVNYYLKIGANEKAYQTLNNRQTLLRYDVNEWNATFDFYRAKLNEAAASMNKEEIQMVREYASEAYSQLDAYLKDSPLDITLSEENEMFRDEVEM